MSRILLRGGCVLSLGVKTSNLPVGDVLIDGDRIAEVGQGVRARDAEVVDAADTIVMPGFVDTHRHASRSLFRNLGDSPSADGAGPGGGPDDVYAATLVGLLGAAEAAITTVVDWVDTSADDTVDAVLQAHEDAGLRTVLVRGGGALDGLADLAERAGPMTTVAWGAADEEAGPQDAVAAGWDSVRQLGLRIHVHASGPAGSAVRLGERGVLGPDVTFVHCARVDDADLDAVAAARASVSLAPSSEMAAGLGPPPIQRLIDRDIRPGLAVGDERVAPGDMFAQMRAAISMQHAIVFELKLAGKAGLPRLMSTRDVIRHATVDGAHVAGLGGVTGSLVPGMQADVIVLRTDRPNIFPVNDPIGAVVWGMDTSNVDWVIAGGRVLMREGTLQADVPRARALAAQARERVGSVPAVAVSPGAEA